MVTVGQPAPDFTLLQRDGTSVTISQYKGQKNVVLSFHVYSFTGGWTYQVSCFGMSCPEFVEKGTQVLGISTDSSATSAAFAALLGNIPYPLLSDFEPKGRVARLYGVYNEERGTANRSVIIVDKQGIVRFKRLYAAMSEFNTDDVLAAVDKL